MINLINAYDRFPNADLPIAICDDCGRRLTIEDHAKWGLYCKTCRGGNFVEPIIE